MSRRHIPAYSFGLLSGWLVAEMVLLWPRLPPRLATHFGFAGEPNGWSTPSHFLIMSAVVVAVFGGLFALASRLERTPDRFLNLPNKAYWLDVHRRAASLATLRDWLRWFLVITLAALVVLMSEVLRANLSAPPHLSINPILGLAVLVLPQFIMIVWLFRRFRLPRA